MRTTSILCFSLFFLAASQAWSACMPLRLAYIDQHRPPFYLGSGDDQAPLPGASVELLHEIAASAGCRVKMSRLPPLRLRAALESNAVDAAPLSVEGQDFTRFAYPRDKAGKLDGNRAMQLHIMLFVRASDKLAPDTDPARLLAGKRVGAVHGAAIVQRLRDMGTLVDDGAANPERNLDKLMLGRIDVFAMSLIEPGDMDAVVAARHGKQIVRLDKPAQSIYLWLAFSKSYYAQNREPVETMWTWIGEHGKSRFAELVRKYDKTP